MEKLIKKFQNGRAIYKMGYNIERNSRLYYVWTIRYDKYLCKWSDLTYSISDVNGRGEWVSTSNYRFLVMTYHNRTPNYSQQPDLPSDLNYPGYPPSTYCEMQYMKWRTVQSSSYVGEPFQISFSSVIGDELWRKTTPFEYEMTQSVPIFCSTSPQIPSFTNTVLKNDGSSYYRKFRARWACNSSGSLSYVSGPTYINSVQDRGNSRWEYLGKSYEDSTLGLVYEIIWVSYEAGIGTSPNDVISEDLTSDLLSLCATENSDTNNEVVVGSEYSISNVNSDKYYSGYPIFRVVYNCNLKTYSGVELIAIDQDDRQLRTNSWKYIDIYSELDELKCVFYYYSSNYQKNISLEQVEDLDSPSIFDIDLYSCPCYWTTNIDSALEATNIINLVISGIDGRASSGNNIYQLQKVENENTWKLSDSKKDVVLKYYNSKWDFSLSNNYKNNNYLKINKEILLSDSFIGNFSIVFNDSAVFTDEDGSGTCMLSFEGNNLEEMDNSSSSEILYSNSSSSSSSPSSSSSSSSS